MNLQKGIKLHNQLPDGYDAVSINSGTTFHTTNTIPKVNYKGIKFTPSYEKNAYVNKRDWRKVNAEEIRCLQSSEKRNDYNTVYVGDIPSRLKELFIDMNLTDSVNRDEVLDKFAGNPKKTQAVSLEIEKFLKPISNGRPFNFHCLAANLPNIEHVACDTTKLPKNHKPSDVKYMGIHNDGHQKMTLHTAYKFGNRISFNLGKQTRHFLFVNLSMIQAWNMLKQKIDVKKHGVNVVNIPQFFFRYFPDYPVLRIRQKPYQYYIAPTDNCFHDGSTLGNTELDICLVYFGAFQC